MAQPNFRFTTTGASDVDFTVVSFEGVEGLSKLYSYTIELKAPAQEPSPDAFLDDVLDGDPEFIMEYDGIEYPIYGMLSSFEEKQTAAGYTYYTAVLVPRLWQLTLNRNSVVYNDPSKSTVDEIIKSILDGYLLDYEIGAVTGALRSRDYRCQFNESDFQFISRLLEDEGIYYYFDHSLGSDKIIFSDGLADTAFAADPDITFDAAPPPNRVFESITAWACRKKRLPGSVTVENYNPDAPATDTTGTWQVDSNNLEEQYTWGESFDSTEAGDLAEIRAQELKVLNTTYYGESGVCGLRAGYTFGIAQDTHPNSKFETPDYLLVEVRHAGASLDSVMSTSAEPASGIRSRLSAEHGSGGERRQYENSFVAIESDVQYRPRRETPKPRFYGTINAFVYSEAGGDYAEVDSRGRYRVTLPFRMHTDTEAERATHWIRMVQPYVGIKDGVPEGTYFPLMGDTEVLLTFINGDPDRPVITGAVPNETIPSLVTDLNRNQTILSTHGMYKEDIRGGMTSIVEVNETAERGNSRGTGGDNDFQFEELNTPANNHQNGPTSTGQPLDMESGDFVVSMRFGHQYSWVDGNTYKWDNEQVFSFGNDYEEIHENENGVEEGEVFDMQTPMQSIGDNLTPANTDASSGGIASYSEWEDGSNGLIEKNWGDKCEYHKGRVFCWSGGQGPGESLEVFNYGNGYTENLLESSGGTAASNNLNDARDSYSRFGIDAGKSTIEKTFGDTYSFQKGKTAEVHIGDAESETYGNSKETVHGNADNKVMGATSDMFLGAKNEMNLNAANTMTLGLENELFIGGKIETTLAAIMEFGAGIKISANGTAEFDLKVAKTGVSLVKSDADVTEMQAKVSQLGAVTSDIKTCATKINSLITELDASTISIQTNGLTMIS